jgi:hypothetical protein
MGRKKKEIDPSEISFEVRGKILHFMVELEDSIDTCISAYFCKNDDYKMSEFEAILLSSESFGLRLKKDVIEYLIDKHFQNIGRIYNGKYKEDLKELISIRNKFAHRKFESSKLENGEREYYLYKLNITPNGEILKKLTI